MANNQQRVEELIEEIRKLTYKIESVEQDKSPATEKQILSRELRHNRNELRREFQELVLEQRERASRVQYETDKLNKATAQRAKLTEAIGGEINDNLMKPTEGVELAKYNRALNMCEQYRNSIRETSTKIDTMLNENTNGMTSSAIKNRKLTLQSKIETVKQLSGEYKKYHQELTSTGDAKSLPVIINNLKEVMELTSIMEAKLKLEDDNEKKKLALQKGEQMEGIKITKFSGQGISRYLEYYVWYTEFNELILKKEYSDSIKLKYLKQLTEKDANELVRNYHHGKELMLAVKTLDEHYGKPSMVIRESLRNLRTMDSVKTQNDVRANRRLISTINTNISTLRCYNFDLEGNDVENSTFLIEIEEKVPHDVFIKWEEEKHKMRAS